MKSNDLGLSVYQMRLLTCADIVRNGTAPLRMRSWAHCAVGDYCMAKVSDLQLQNSVPQLPTGEESWNAVETHFGLSGDEAMALFDEDSYREIVSRSEVADRIEHFALHEHADTCMERDLVTDSMII